MQIKSKIAPNKRVHKKLLSTERLVQIKWKIQNVEVFICLKKFHKTIYCMSLIAPISYILWNKN